MRYSVSFLIPPHELIRQQREGNKTIEVVTAQLNAVAKVTNDWSNIVIAYEPVW